MNRAHDWQLARIKAHLVESAEVKQRTIEQCAGPISAAAEMIAETFQAGGKLLLCGNGGSAADCQHMAAEFVNRLNADTPRQGLPALALTTDTSFITSFANDVGFEGVFARQIQALGTAHDVLLAISTSGGSPNILQAIETAHSMGMNTIALTTAKSWDLIASIV